MEQFNVSYSQLKTIQSNRGLSYSYVTGSNFWTIFLVDVVKDAVFVCTLANDGSDSTNATDFQNNIQSGATQFSSLDDGVAQLVSSFLPTTVIFSANSIASVASEALMSFVATTITSTGASQAQSATHYTVPAGKVLILEAGIISASAGNLLSNVNMDYKVRVGSSVTVSSPIAFDAQMMISANNSEVTPLAIPGGITIPAGQQIAFTQSGGTGITGAFTITGILV